MTTDSKINLGAGRKHKHGYISVDYYSEFDQAQMDGRSVRYHNGDAIGYIESLSNDSVSEVYSRHFLEHLDRGDLTRLVSNVERILVSGGTARFIVPHWANPFYYSDPTHVQHFGLYSFDYLSRHPYLRRSVPNYSVITEMKVARVEIRFISCKALRPLTWVASKIVNLSRFLLEFYEANLANLLPPYELEFTLLKS
jgi:predicted SAM-dependent methyltransferase